MKIYLLPYTFKTYFSIDKFHSGIDMSTFKTMALFRLMGHETRLFSVAGDKHNDFTILNESLTSSDNIKDYVKQNRKDIYFKLLQDIKDFKPDLIFSSYELGALYKTLSEHFDIPIIYQTHANPGFFADLNNGNLLNDLSACNLSIVCVSDYHKKKFEAYYKKTRSDWSFKQILVDCVLPSSYIEQKATVVKSDGVVRHISALNPEKKTFLIHEYLDGTNIQSEVFTTNSYLKSNDDKLNRYANKHLAKYADKTYFNIEHKNIMKQLSSSICSFVGLASYDTYTITSLESLSRGVPLIVYGDKEYNHPALEMCCSDMIKDFIRVVRTKEDFLSAVQLFATYSLSDRQRLADLAYDYNSADNMKINIDSMFTIAFAKTDKYRCNTIQQFLS